MRPHLLAALGAAVLAIGLTPLTATAAPSTTPSGSTPATNQTETKPATASQSSATDATKLDVLGVWAHPDDDAGLTTPCGIWGDRHDLKCGIMLTTRGEGGSNSVGDEAGPDLAKRRENEDRTSHVRMGTEDIYYLDRVDFFYNTSAPLTQEVWNHDETLRRAVRVVRETRPEILTTWTPSLAAGHGNHQEAGRLTWEVARAAADPTKFPEQLTGEHAVKTWQIKRILEMPNVEGDGAKNQANCLADFESAPENPYPVVGLWTGYESPYTWAKGNTAGVKAGTKKTWAQVGTEGAKMHATQARSMQKDKVESSCLKWSVPFSAAPMQPESEKSGRNDDSALYGAAIADPGGLPAGSLFYAEPEEYRVGGGESTTVTVHARSGKGQIAGGEVRLSAPKGWNVSAPQKLGSITEAGQDLTFTVTAPQDAASTPVRVKVQFDGGAVTAYNETTVLPVDGVEGRFQRWGNTAEYDEWTEKNAAYSGGPSEAYRQIGAGESVTVPITVTNHTSDPASGTVKLDAPQGIEVAEASAAFDGLAAGESTTKKFVVTHTDPSAAGGDTKDLSATTTSGTGSSSEKIKLEVVPTAKIDQLKTAPKIDGSDDGYTSTLDLSTVWEGDKCDPDGTDCGSGSTAKVGWQGDDFYALIDVKDERASAAATPNRCFGHWLVDSTEILMDPRGDSDDTSTTFKLGVFPFTDDAKNTNGNGANGPCWERDADFHQGFSTGPLADTVLNAPNAPGVQVAAKAQRNAKGTYTDGKWTVEVKIPLSNLPEALKPASKAPTGSAASNDVDPSYLGLNVTPYDSDTQDFIGQTRLAWSAHPSQQSEPYRWGHAYLAGYRSVGANASAKKTGQPIIPNTALSGADSPQTIHQSAMRGVPIAGLTPAKGASASVERVGTDSVDLNLAGAKGSFHAYLFKGDPSHQPVWTTSCADQAGFDACSTSDGKAAAWGKDMAGRVLAEGKANAAEGKLKLSFKGGAQALGDDTRVLVSYRSAGEPGTTDAWSIPVQETPAPTTDPSDNSSAEPTDSSQPGTPDGTASGEPNEADGSVSASAPSAGTDADQGEDSSSGQASGDHLSSTGANVLWALGIVVVLVLLGVVALLVGRRSRGGQRH